MEDLMIYKQFVELCYYTEMILKKFPKSERYNLCNDIKNNTYDGLKLIIISYKEFDKRRKVKLLNDLDVQLKFLKVLIRISKRNKYINSKNYIAWVKKITNISNLLGGWINVCAKV